MPTAQQAPPESVRIPSSTTASILDPRLTPLRECWIDVYDEVNFAGERRRFFGPLMLDAALLALVACGKGPVSVRVGNGALLRITFGKSGSAGATSDYPGGSALLVIDLRTASAISINPALYIAKAA